MIETIMVLLIKSVSIPLTRHLNHTYHSLFAWLKRIDTAEGAFLLNVHLQVLHQVYHHGQSHRYQGRGEAPSAFGCACDLSAFLSFSSFPSHLDCRFLHHSIVYLLWSKQFRYLCPLSRLQRD